MTGLDWGHAFATITARPANRARLVRMSTNILIFAIGCGAAALLYSRVGVKCFLVPPIVGSLQLIARLSGWSQPR
jgi:hypothetical protein